MQVNMSLIPEFEELWNSFAQDEQKVKFLEIEGIAPKNLDIGIQSMDFFKNKLAEITTDSNSNYAENMNPTVYRTHTSNGQMKLLGYHLLWYHAKQNYGLEWANKAISMIWEGALYFHDAHGLRIQMPYCYAFSLDKIVFEGRQYGSSPNTPPKHRKSFLSQVDKLISDLSKQFAGATAPSDLFLWYSYFLGNEFKSAIDDNMDILLPQIERVFLDDMQGLVCLFNEPGRAEGEPPFTNISIFDDTGLENLFGHIVFPNGERPNFKLIMALQKSFCKWFSKGDPITGFPYRFPVVTINMTTDTYDSVIDEDFVKWVADVNKEKANFNLHFGQNGKLAMCCRYTNDLSDMDATPDSFGNGGVNIGSHRVVTPNFARCAIRSKGNEELFMEYCDELLDISAKLLDIHRNDILGRRIEKTPHYLQFFGSLGWFSLDTMFSTIGLTGIYEMCEYMGYDILEEDGTEFVMDFMYYLKNKIAQFKNEYGCAFNIEEIPGEQACVSLINKDHISFEYFDFSDINDDIQDSFKNCKLYSNQYIPLINGADIATRLDLSGRFMKLISGGGVVHINVEAEIDTTEKMEELIKLVAKSGVNHCAICYKFGKCEDHPAIIVGQHENRCPICNKNITHMRTRVIGYFSDIHNWHPTRQKFDAPLRHYSSVK